LQSPASAGFCFADHASRNIGTKEALRALRFL
jgi:hypothetical protein